MSLSQAPKTYSLLSIGQRGVGKTVFLAGSYADLADRQQYRSQSSIGGSFGGGAALPEETSELCPGGSEPAQRFWLECQERQAQEKMNNLLRYIVQTGCYPPLTASITNFNFSLKKHQRKNEQTLCHFRWWDMPGELCNFDSPEFRQLVFSSNGCCVFIDADALVHQPDYQRQIGRLMEQVIPILMLIHLNQLHYPIALLLTKCDSLDNNAATRQRLEQKVKAITNQWELLEINHRTFRLAIPILNTQNGFSLRAKGASQALLWLLSELERVSQKAKRQPTKSV